MAENFEGHSDRECGEHRTVGSHRAWCFDCHEWCYPNVDMACRGCELPHLRRELAEAQATWVCDSCMGRVVRWQISVMADGEHVLCVWCHSA